MVEHRNAALEKFCQAYTQCANATLAYRDAYDPGSIRFTATHGSKGSLLLKRPDVVERIRELRQARAESFAMSEEVLREIWAAIATADASELSTTVIGACRHCYGDDHLYQWTAPEWDAEMKRYAISVLDSPKTPLPDIAGGIGYNHTLDPLPDCPQCHGEGISRVLLADMRKVSMGARRLFAGVKQTRHGVEIMTVDKTKALDALARMMGLYKDREGTNSNTGAAIGQMNVYIQQNVNDPNEAAKLYEQMMRGLAINPVVSGQHLLTAPS